MFTKLPELLGRNFIIGYLLPAFALTVSTYLIDAEYNFLPTNIDLNFLRQINTIQQITVIGLLSLWLGIILLIFNREIISFLEGYGKYNPFRLLLWLEKSRFHNLEKQISATKNDYFKYSDKGESVPVDIKDKYLILMTERVVRFPDEERWLLPTSFGNTLRAFETYSRVMYGADAIPIWTRLLAVIPEDYSQFIDAAKTKVDLWVNTWVASIVLVIIYLANLIYFQQLKLFWLPLACLAVAYISFQQARKAAVGWGNFVKAAFDLFLDDLKDKLTISEGSSQSNNEGDMWQKFSQAVLYVAPESMPEKPINQKPDQN